MPLGSFVLDRYMKTYLRVMNIEFLTKLLQRREGEKGCGGVTQACFVGNVLFASSLLKKLIVKLGGGYAGI